MNQMAIKRPRVTVYIMLCEIVRTNRTYAGTASAVVAGEHGFAGFRIFNGQTAKTKRKF